MLLHVLPGWPDRRRLQRGRLRKNCGHLVCCMGYSIYDFGSSFWGHIWIGNGSGLREQGARDVDSNFDGRLPLPVIRRVKKNAAVPLRVYGIIPRRKKNNTDPNTNPMLRSP